VGWKSEGGIKGIWGGCKSELLWLGNQPLYTFAIAQTWVVVESWQQLISSK